MPVLAVTEAYRLVDDKGVRYCVRFDGPVVGLGQAELEPLVKVAEASIRQQFPQVGTLRLLSREEAGKSYLVGSTYLHFE